ncbi:hypothetical protein OROMI_006489 [Orobanche minor]
MVKAGELANKLIAVYLVPLQAVSLEERMATTHLIDTYNYLLPHNVFEVVLVAYETDKTLRGGSNIDPEKQFETMFSRMPWTAIPFSDKASRDCLTRRFGVCQYWSGFDSFVIDSTGRVLQDRCLYLFEKYGGLGYPFTNERIRFLESQDAALAEQPSLKKLLASPERDYVISNKGDKVPIDTLEEKVVALYFYEEGKTLKKLTTFIELAYKEFAKKKKEFEVVLIYLHNTEHTCGYTNEESFSKTFKTMPWLALPFKDPTYAKLKRFFGYNYDLGERVDTPSLVIFGPYGEFIEPWGADILMTYKLPAYPFTREKVAKLETEKIKELRLEMLWARNTFFRRNDGTEVPLQELVGKRIILFFEGKYYSQYEAGFLNVLRNSYARMKYLKKGTYDDEFEVIYITRKGEALYEDMIFDVPWLFALESQLLPIVDLSVCCCYCTPEQSLCNHAPGWCGKWSTLLAFNRDGKIVSKSIHLSGLSGNDEFPFCDADMEKRILFELNIRKDWFELDQQYRGLLINSLYQGGGP